MGEGRGSPVILLHGLFGAAANWGRVQRALAERHETVALDLRNHGASGHDPDVSYPAMAADVAETMQALGLSAAGVLGHSMGGKTGMMLALTRPGLVRRLLVADIAPVAYPPRQRAVAAALQALPLIQGLTRAQADAALAPALPEAALRAFLLQNLRPGAHPSWRIGLDELARGLPLIEGWPAVRATYEGPVLVLRGECSDYVPQDSRPAVRALFPHARFATLRGAGHWLHADQPEAFIRTSAAFFA